MKRVAPKLKMPKVVSDLYYDLHDRRLLPLVALILVAIAAVPILLGNDGEKEVSPSPGAGTAPGAETRSGASSLAVVEATPGLRDYRKRLEGRGRSDPFVQKFTEPSGSTGGESGDAGGGSAGTEATTGGAGEPADETVVDSPESRAPGDSAESGSNGGGSTGEEGELKLFEFVGDIQISRTEPVAGGGTEMGETKTRHQVKGLTSLPGPKMPVVTFLGPNLKTERAVFSVSKDVTGIEGQKVCLAGVDRCELLEVERGSPLVFDYGTNGVRFKIKVVKFDVVPVEKDEASASVQRFTK